MHEDPAILRKLIDAALDLPAEARDEWLNALPREHAALTPRLRTLLARAAQVETSDFLETLPKLDFIATESAGEEIGPYRLVREIGAGGMGAVWLAERHDGALKRAVALKFLRAHGPRDALVERLARERDILADLVHPGIARLYDAGVSREGLPYLALEYIEGEHIDTYCRTHGVDIRTRLLLFGQIAKAVAYAHSRLVVHRDLKPSNILVSRDRQVHLLDFGIAKLLEDGRALETRLTQSAGRALTPEYASPEQILGEPITTASDVYSLGVILYELLTDSRPYRLKRSSRGALEDAILELEPQRPSERAASQAKRRTLRGDLDAIVLKALKKKPQERYVTVSALAEDVERHLQGRPVTAQPDSALYRFGKFVARNKLAVGSTAGVLIAVLAAAAVAIWQGRLAIAEQHRAEQVKDFVTSIFADASPWIGPQETPSAVELLQRARRRVDDVEGWDPGTRLELLTVIGESYLGLGATAEAGQIAEGLVSQSVEQLGLEHALTLRAQALRIQVLRNQGRIAEARSNVESLLASLLPSSAEQPQATVKALNDRAELELDAGRYKEAEQTAHEAMALATRHREAWEPRTWEETQSSLWKVVASSRDGLVSYSAAVEAAQRALDHAQAAYRGQPKHPFLINTRLVFARTAATAGDAPRAIEMMKEAIADSAALYGPEHRIVGTYSQNLAVWQTRIGDFDAAQASIDRALPIIEREIGADSAHYGAALDAAAYLALHARRPAQARALYERAYAVAAGVLPPDSEHPTVVRMRSALARAHLGEFDAALAELRSIAGEFESKGFSAPSRSLHALGEAERLAGQFRSALEHQLAGLALVAEGASAGRERMSFFTEIGLDYLALGEPEEAIENLERALALIAAHQTFVTPLRADALAGLGRVRMAAGREREALISLQEADTFWRQFAPDNRCGGEAALWLGRSYLANGRSIEADEALRRAERLLSASAWPSDAQLVKLARMR